MKTFTQYLTEASQKCDEIFGKYLFGEFTKYYNSVKEMDTPQEKQIFSLIRNFIRGEYVGKTRDEILVKALFDLHKCKSKYGKILKPKTSVLYRGITISKKDVNIDKLKKDSPLNLDFEKSFDYVYKGRSKVQSWTDNYKTAIYFAEETWEETPNRNELYIAILKANFKQSEILFDSSFLNTLSKSVGYGEENEIIRIENKPIKVKAYLSNLNMKEQ
jgi:hypothetical protein